VVSALAHGLRDPGATCSCLDSLLGILCAVELGGDEEEQVLRAMLAAGLIQELARLGLSLQREAQVCNLEGC
jgi:hypothetical protein